MAASVQGPFVVQAVGPLVLWPAGLALLQRRASASPPCQLWFLPENENNSRREMEDWSDKSRGNDVIIKNKTRKLLIYLLRVSIHVCFRKVAGELYQLLFLPVG